LPGNNRPISVLPILSKIFEKHVATIYSADNFRKYGPKSSNPVAFDVSNLLSKDSVWSFLIKGSSKLKGQSVTEVTFT
jgi:hypothetical protein